MKTLILLRHGDAEPYSPTGDHGRALSPQGLRDAQDVGRALRALPLQPDRLLTSTANRARMTAAQLGFHGSPQEINGLYESSAPAALAALRDLGGDDACRLVVGHQPTLGDLAATLIGGGQLNVGTACALGIGLSVDRWEDLRAGRAWLLWMLTPQLARALSATARSPQADPQPPSS